MIRENPPPVESLEEKPDAPPVAPSSGPVVPKQVMVAVCHSCDDQVVVPFTKMKAGKKVFDAPNLYCFCEAQGSLMALEWSAECLLESS